MEQYQEVVIKPRQGGVFVNLWAVWQHRSLLSYFVARTIRSRYKETILGWLWLVIRPIVPALLYTVIFGRLANIPSDGTPYILFFFTGNCLWSLFASSLLYATRSLQMNRRLITKLYFPRLIVPISSISPFVVEFFINFAILLALFAYYVIKEGDWYLNSLSGLVFAPIFVILTLMLALGIGFWTSVFNAQARDVRFTLPYVLQMWMFFTPVIYPLSFVPDEWRSWAALNPLTGLFEGFKWSLLGKGEIDTIAIALSAGIIAIIFMSGVWFFTRAEATFVDNL